MSITQEQLNSWYEPRECDEDYKLTQEELDQKEYDDMRYDDLIASYGQY